MTQNPSDCLAETILVLILGSRYYIVSYILHPQCPDQYLPFRHLRGLGSPACVSSIVRPYARIHNSADILKSMPAAAEKWK